MPGRAPSEPSDPDDRVWLIDELPATVAQRLLQGLPDDERRLTAAILGYPQESIGRRMSPEYVATHPQDSVGSTVAAVRQRVADAETAYTLPVVDEQRRVIGVVRLRDLLGGADSDLVGSLMVPAHTATATEDAEDAARRCADLGVLALPVVDNENRLVGMTVLALFVPLLIGTGGNTGNQAATTVTRALALGDVRPADLVAVLLRELRGRRPARCPARRPGLRPGQRVLRRAGRHRHRADPGGRLHARSDHRRCHAARGPGHQGRPGRFLQPLHHHLRRRQRADHYFLIARAVLGL